MDAATLIAKIKGHDAELQKGSAMLSDLERRTNEVKATMLRITGARQQCVEFLSLVEGTPLLSPEDIDPKTATIEPIPGNTPEA